MKKLHSRSLGNFYCTADVGTAVAMEAFGFANATSLARIRHPKVKNLASFARQEFSSASPRGLLFSMCSGNVCLLSG
jgi:hypothetical protein